MTGRDPLWEIHALVVAQNATVGRIEGKLEGIDKRIAQREAEHDQLEERTRALEGHQKAREGVTRMLSVLAGLVSGAIAGFFGRHFT